MIRWAAPRNVDYDANGKKKCQEAFFGTGQSERKISKEG